MNIRMIAIILLSTLSAPAFAVEDEEKFFYFYQNTKTTEAVIADHEFCREYASRVNPPKGGYVYTPDPASAGAAGFLGGIQKSSNRRKMARAVLRKCMTTKGYRRFFLEEEKFDAVYEGGWEKAKFRLAALAIGDFPTDKELPS